MGFLKMLQKEKKEHSLGVCIPSHEREKIDIEIAEVKARNERDAKTRTAEDTAFEVEGYYEVMKTAMLSGLVLKGKITKKNKAVVSDKEYKITEVQKAHKKVPALEEGDHGAVFLKGKGLLVQTGNVIEFK